MCQRSEVLYSTNQGRELGIGGCSRSVFTLGCEPCDGVNVADEACREVSRGVHPLTFAVGGRVYTACDGRLVREQIETVCEQCGLVVSEDALRREMCPSVHKQGEFGNGPVKWSLERTTPLRVDNGLHTTFFLGSDGYGNSLTTAQKDKFDRLRMRHKRFQMESDRQIRLNEGLGDIQMIVESRTSAFRGSSRQTRRRC